MTKAKLGVALVGLGRYAEKKLAPVLQETAHCHLTGIVTGISKKAEKWRERYNIPQGNIYSYQTFDAITDNADIDIVYVVLPNALHAEYVIRAAKAGKHVICEKPMEVNTEACKQMIETCRAAGVKLSIGYRLHFEPYNLEMARLCGEERYGSIQKIRAGFGFEIGAHEWRLNHQLAGGGPLVDVGIYCIQACCYLTGKRPVAVTAEEGKKTEPEKFRSVEQSLTWQLEFEDGLICECRCAYDQQMDFFEVITDAGSLMLQPAYGYGPQLGITPDGIMSITHVNEQAKQMDDFALAIKEQRDSPVPGEMGLRDVAIIEAIYAATRSGEKQRIHYVDS